VKTMLELQNNQLVFNFPEVHENARLTINFQRTLRIPDDGKRYPLPPGLGNFPMKHIDDHRNRIPKEWLKRGGVMIPMYQSEALWIHFSSNYASNRSHAYPFAIKVATGKVSAITGEKWEKGLNKKDYVIAPEQPWLDGYVVEKNMIRQFVATPLGMGFTAEEQITKKAEFGGIQIEVFPMKREIFEKRFPVLPPPQYSGGGIIRGFSMPGVYTMSLNTISCNASMGMAPGGMMTQQIFDDPYNFEDWDTKYHDRCFVHLMNSMTWRAVTGENPPITPTTSAEYERRGLPWFDFYNDDLKALDGTKKLKGLKSVAKMEKKKNVKILPENQSVKPGKIINLSGKNQVRDGKWV